MQLRERETERWAFAGMAVRAGGHGRGRVCRQVGGCGAVHAGAVGRGRARGRGKVEIAAARRLHRQPALVRARGRPGLTHAGGGRRGHRLCAGAGSVIDVLRRTAPGLCRAALRERALEGVIDELVHRARFAEADLDLRRVHVDVDPRRVELKEQHVGRMAAAVQDVGVGFAHRVGEQLVAHEATIDEEILRVAAGA